MIKRFFCIILFAIVFNACQQETVELVLPPEILVKVLADAHIAEGAVLSVRPSHKDSIREFYYGQIYEIHEIEADDFEHDIKVLKLNPKLMEKVYGKVMQELDKRASDLEKEDPKQKK